MSVTVMVSVTMTVRTATAPTMAMTVTTTVTMTATATARPSLFLLLLPGLHPRLLRFLASVVVQLLSFTLSLLLLLLHQLVHALVQLLQTRLSLRGNSLFNFLLLIPTRSTNTPTTYPCSSILSRKSSNATSISLRAWCSKIDLSWDFSLGSTISWFCV